MAEEDQFVPKEVQKKLSSELSTNENITIYSYPGVDHAFARINGAHYDQEAAELANTRTSEFFKSHLT